jgi:VWFA-related protein
MKMNDVLQPLGRALIALLLLSAISLAQNSWEEKNHAGEKAFQEGRLADANRLFAEALGQAQQFGQNDVRLAPIYNNLALVSFVQNNFIASEALYEKSIAVMQAQGPDNALLLPVLDNLTRLYVKQWAFSNAIRTAWRACHIREKKFGPANLETATGLNKLASLYLDNVRLLPQSSDDLPASKLANKTLSASDSSPDFKDLSASFENAPELDDATKLAIAESLFTKVFEIQEKAYGEVNSRLVDVLQNLGEVRRAQEKTIAAEEAYTKTLAIVEKGFGPDDFKLATPLQQLAELKTESGNYADAEKLYQRALQIDQDKAGASDPSLVSLLTGYAAILEKMNRPDEAKTLTARAASLAPRTPANASSSPAASVPYIMRFEKSVYDQYAGFQHTCMLVRADGRFRVEERQQERVGSVIVQELPHPDNEGIGSQEKLSDTSHSSHGPKVFDSSLDAGTLQQLEAILSAREVRDLQGSYAPHKATNSSNTEQIAASILRDDGVQNFAFPDTSSLQPYESKLKPLLRWLNTAEKHKGPAIKSAIANNCSPDLAEAVPGQSLAARPKPLLASPSVSTLKVDVKLVPVVVVVKDAQGRAVGNLTRADFEVFDQGKPQVITQFSVEQVATQETLMPSQPGKPSGQPATSARYTAYLFDDLHLERPDLVRAREAADRQVATLSPATERAAIFTTSGQKGIDFTADRDKLHETLIHLEPRKKQQASECPAMSYQMAALIANERDEDARHVAAEAALECAFDTKNLESIDNVKYRKTAFQMADSAAREKVDTVRIENESLLRILKGLVAGMSKAPGQRTILVVSPGFFLPESQDEVEIIDQAVRANVIVSALDPRGLVPSGDVRDQSIDTFDPNNPEATTYRDLGDGGLLAALRELTDGTGGIFFHHGNDLEEGFKQVAAAPEYSYVLAFVPHDVPLDGRFHKLKVTVSGGTKLTVQARKGYYAPPNKQ